MTKLPFPSRMNSGRLRGEWVASFRGKYSASKLKSSTGTFVFRNDSGRDTFTLTLGDQNATNSTGNNILVRIKLESGDSVTALSIE